MVALCAKLHTWAHTCSVHACYVYPVIPGGNTIVIARHRTCHSYPLYLLRAFSLSWTLFSLMVLQWKRKVKSISNKDQFNISCLLHFKINLIILKLQSFISLIFYSILSFLLYFSLRDFYNSIIFYPFLSLLSFTFFKLFFKFSLPCNPMPLLNSAIHFYKFL